MRSDIKIANATIAQSNQCIIIFKTTVKTVISGCWCCFFFGTNEWLTERSRAKEPERDQAKIVIYLNSKHIKITAGYKVTLERIFNEIGNNNHNDDDSDSKTEIILNYVEINKYVLLVNASRLTSLAV